jgi:oligopeptide transport system permease protein
MGLRLHGVGDRRHRGSPNFVLASLGVIAFVFVLNLFPAAGWGSLGQLILPALCLAATVRRVHRARLTRTGMLEVLGLDYIRTATAPKGWRRGM